MKALNQALLKKFLTLAGERLTGKWVLVGGTVLPALGAEYRSTVDIDFVGLPLDSPRETLALMQIAEDLGLPIESVNQAAAYFVSKIPDFDASLVLLHKGKNAVIYRPSLELFIRLKLARLSETDLTDCLEFLRLADSLGETLDRKALAQVVRTELKKSKVTERTGRIQQLLKALKV